MINNHMDSENQVGQQENKIHVPTEKPNESTGLYVRGFVKISDPETGTVILETAN